MIVDRTRLKYFSFFAGLIIIGCDDTIGLKASRPAPSTLPDAGRNGYSDFMFLARQRAPGRLFG